MEDVYTSFKPFFVIGKVFGTFPIFMDSSAKKITVKEKIADFITSFLSIGVFCAIFMVNFIRQGSLLSSSKILDSAWRLSLLLCLAMMIVSLFYQLFKRESIIKNITILNRIDKMVKF